LRNGGQRAFFHRRHIDENEGDEACHQQRGGDGRPFVQGLESCGIHVSGTVLIVVFVSFELAKAACSSSSAAWSWDARVFGEN
jgi:hypothetical protein